eukprot:2663026-Pyramimonas_sp.AAC.1
MPPRRPKVIPTRLQEGASKRAPEPVSTGRCWVALQGARTAPGGRNCPQMRPEGLLAFSTPREPRTGSHGEA